MNKALRSMVMTVILILVIAGAGYYVLKSMGKIGGTTGLVKDSGKEISDFSAVFLTNGQVYFGKINSITPTEVDLREIYYLQVNSQQGLQTGDTSEEEAATANPDVSLVKLGNELHGPNDRMRINREQVLFTESLKDGSKVVKAIADYESK